MLYNMPTKFGVSTEQVMLIEMCSEISIHKYLSDSFRVQNDSLCFSSFIQNIPSGRSKRFGNGWDALASDPCC